MFFGAWGVTDGEPSVFALIKSSFYSGPGYQYPSWRESSCLGVLRGFFYLYTIMDVHILSKVSLDCAITNFLAFPLVDLFCSKDDLTPSLLVDWAKLKQLKYIYQRMVSVILCSQYNTDACFHFSDKFHFSLDGGEHLLA